MKPKTILRVAHDRNNPYMQLNRSTAQNKEMSYEAVGMLTYLLSKPDDWQVNIEDLRREGCGRDKAYRILNELIAAKYAVRNVEYDERHRIIEVSYVISEAPLPENPDTEKPDTENPDPANPTLLNKESLEETDSSDQRDDIAAAGARISSSSPDENVDQEIGEVFQAFDANIHTLNQTVAEEIRDAITDYSAAWVRDAIREAALSNGKTWRYVEKILLRWKDKGKPGDAPKNGIRESDGNRYISGKYADIIEH
jgi:DnaD/phage-associated family protein